MNRHVIALLLAALATGCGAGDPEAPPAAEPSAASLETGSFTTEIGGRTIHYEIHGTGPVLMTVPNSWGLTLEGLRALYRPLEEHLTMVYFDPRGMGGSGPVVEEADMGLAAVREDFDALRRHLELDKVNAIGWSNGATNLIFLASERPETLESAIFLHGVARATAEDFAGFADEYPEWFAASNALRQELAREDLSVAEKTELLRRFNLEQAFLYLFADPEKGRAMLPRVWAEVGFSHPHGAYAQQELPLFDLSDRLAGIPARSLVAAGAHDLLPAERAREMHARLPDSTFHLFAASGHFAPLEEPEAFVEVVVGFLEGGP